MRYYQGLLDMDLRQSYVIFICMADPFDRRQYMMQNIYINDAIYQGREMGRAEGIATGMEQATRRNILGAYKKNIPIGVIASFVGKTEAEVQEIIRLGQTETLAH